MLLRLLLPLLLTMGLFAVKYVGCWLLLVASFMLSSADSLSADGLLPPTLLLFVLLLSCCFYFVNTRISVCLSFSIALGSHRFATAAQTAILSLHHSLLFGRLVLCCCLYISATRRYEFCFCVLPCYYTSMTANTCMHGDQQSS
ncbi:unnamed protein product [Ceratitis capitata]|uniref:(Mediterranean fruit fly) hypothetical protein n=1 Tax=Ceratitis capitata TaxID=7213 RepID=A0A811UNJ9_CERCA|nr:unnamed protein product [Ceratitis capitata]